MLMHKDALSRKYDGIVACSDVEALANGKDSDFLLPFYKPARTEILDNGMPGERGYHDWLEVTLRQRTLTILFTDDFGKPGYTEGALITLQEFEGWQKRVVARVGVVERVEGGWSQYFDIEVESE